MTLKRTDLAKNKFLKARNELNAAGTPNRFGEASTALPDRKEQRKLDQAAGLVPFAVKLSGELVATLRTRACERRTGINELVDVVMRKGLEK